MKKKLQELSDIFDAVINQINAGQLQKGTGLTFYYNLKVDTHDKDTIYIVSFSLREIGHGERVLQSIPFKKLESLDRYAMEYQVILAVMTILIETALIEWNELGKLLNTDIKLQQAARESLKQ